MEKQQTLRKCTVYGWKNETNFASGAKRILIGEGIFHQFGINHGYHSNGSDSTYTSAIVEMPNGRVLNIPVTDIMFKKEQEEI